MQERPVESDSPDPNDWSASTHKRVNAMTETRSSLP